MAFGVMITPLGFCVDTQKVPRHVWIKAVIGNHNDVGRAPRALQVALQWLEHTNAEIYFNIGTGASHNEKDVVESTIMWNTMKLCIDGVTEDKEARIELRRLLNDQSRRDADSLDTEQELTSALASAGRSSFGITRFELITDRSHIARASDTLNRLRVEAGLDHIITSAIGADTSFSDDPTVIFEGMSGADARRLLEDGQKLHEVLRLFFPFFTDEELLPLLVGKVHEVLKTHLEALKKKQGS